MGEIDKEQETHKKQNKKHQKMKEMREGGLNEVNDEEGRKWRINKETRMIQTRIKQTIQQIQHQHSTTFDETTRTKKTRMKDNKKIQQPFQHL